MHPTTVDSIGRALRHVLEPAQRDGTQGPGEDLDFYGLAQTLIDKAAEQGHTAGDDNVILDVEIGGVRCLLVVPAQEMTHAPLSPREREIVRMIAAGYPNKTIAVALGISTWTVGTHLRRTFNKLKVNSRAAMVARLAQEGILEEIALGGALIPHAGDANAGARLHEHGPKREDVPARR